MTVCAALLFAAGVPGARADVDSEADADPDAVASTHESQGWRIGVYAGQWLDRTLVDVLRLQADVDEFRSSYAAGLSVTREVYTIAEPLRLELEGQLVQHAGEQTHQELVALAALRWTRFPWDDYVDTSIAIGEGLSFATEEPEIENSDEETSRLLNYLLFELELKPGRESRWALVTRIHHRSGIFGLFGGVSGGSNIIMLGVRYAY